MARAEEALSIYAAFAIQGITLLITVLSGLKMKTSDMHEHTSELLVMTSIRILSLKPIKLSLLRSLCSCVYAVFIPFLGLATTLLQLKENWQGITNKRYSHIYMTTTCA